MRKNTIIILCGLPKAGKTLLSGGLFSVLKERGKSFFIERLSPDCEGQWTLETENGGDRAREMKNKLKEKNQFFTSEFVNLKCQGIKNLSKNFKYLILDLGGIPSVENERFIDTAIGTESEVVVVVVCREDQDPTEWCKFLDNFDNIDKFIYITNWNFNGNIKEQAKREAIGLFLKIEQIINK